MLMTESIVFTIRYYYRGKGNTLLFNDDHIYKLEFQTACAMRIKPFTPNSQRPSLLFENS